MFRSTRARTLAAGALVLAVAAPGGAQQSRTRVPLSALHAFTGLMPKKDVVVGDASGFTVDPTTGFPNYWPGGPRAPLNPAYAFPGTAPTEQNKPLYNPVFGDGLEGVARLQIKDANGVVQFGCSGSLISAHVVLTAAHCVSFDDAHIFAGGVDATFLGAGGSTTTISSQSIMVMPGYTGNVVDTHDIALIELGRDADAWIPRYGIYGGNPLFQPYLMAGYGLSGNGITGGVINTLFQDTPTLRVAFNRWELSADDAFIYAGSEPGGPILFSDFDGGNGESALFPVTGEQFSAGDVFSNNTLCNFSANAFGGQLPIGLLLNICLESYGPQGYQIGYGAYEGLIGSGDSGGPAFVFDDQGNLRVAAVTSFGDFTCVPDQRLDAATGAPNPRSDDLCSQFGYPPGYVEVGSLYGFTSGHVFAGAGAQREFINSHVAPEPSTLLLLVGGLVPLGVAARRRRRA